MPQQEEHAEHQEQELENTEAQQEVAELKIHALGQQNVQSKSQLVFQQHSGRLDYDTAEEVDHRHPRSFPVAFEVSDEAKEDGNLTNSAPVKQISKLGTSSMNSQFGLSEQK